jgi:hypothetical protein
MFPEAFKVKHALPSCYNIPDEMQYEYMIHTICKAYGISKREGASHTETDFWELTAFENLQSAKEEYIFEHSGKQQKF